MLDTDTVSQLVKKSPNPQLWKRLCEVSRGRLFLSTVTTFELRFGCAKKGGKAGDKLWATVEERIVSAFNVVDFNGDVSLRAGVLLATLYEQGTPIGLEDTFIAATALSRGFVMVTGNTRHYSQVPGLKIENWLAE